MRKQSIVITILEAIFEAGRYLPMPLETPYAHVQRMRRLERGYYNNYVRQMERRGEIKVTKKDGRKFIKITNKGELHLLFKKAQMPAPRPRDGKLRLLMFDIPEDCREKRQVLRQLLRQNKFRKLQASVYISRLTLNREAVEFLRKTKLIDYIRIMRVDGVDDKRSIDKLFKIK